MLSSKTQREERLKLQKFIAVKESEKQKNLFDAEQKKYDNNTQCETNVISSYIAIQKIRQNNTINNTPRPAFIDLVPNLTAEHFGRQKYKGLHKLKSTNDQLKAFVHVRRIVIKYKGKSPVYTSLTNIKRDQLIDRCFEVRMMPVQPRQFKITPQVQTCNVQN